MNGWLILKYLSWGFIKGFLTVFIGGFLICVACLAFAFLWCELICHIGIHFWKNLPVYRDGPLTIICRARQCRHCGRKELGPSYDEKPLD